MEQFKITKENYKGYTELIRTIAQGADLSTQDAKRLIIPEILLMFPGFFSANLNFDVIGGIMILAGFSLPIITALKKYKNEINNVKKQYPYVDTHINYDVLEKALKEVNIITIEDGKKILNIDGYKKHLEEEKIIKKYNEIKEEYLKETKYNSIDYNIEEIETVKVKTLGSR